MLIVFKSLLTTPIVWIITVFVVATALIARVRRQSRAICWGWRSLVVGLAVLISLSLPSVAQRTAGPLERWYSSPDAATLADIDAVVILSGGIRVADTLQPFAELAPATYRRVVQGVRVFTMSGADRLVFMGLSDGVEGTSDAAVMRDFAVLLGVSLERIIIEEQSRNTAEHARELPRVLQLRPDQNIGIATSAIHLPRAVQAFRAALPGTRIIPLPVAYATSTRRLNVRDFVPSVDAFALSTAAMHEWIGMTWYAMRY